MKALYWVLYLGTFALLVVGAQLQVLKQALVCPEWPLCFGEFLPLYTSPSFYEKLHRSIAALIGVGSFFWGLNQFKTARFKAWLPFFLVVMQTLLGWATFYYKLPTITTVLHICLALIFFAAIEGTKKIEFPIDLKTNWNPKHKDKVAFFFGLLVFQFVLGAILRKSSLLASCEAEMEFWACWQKQSEIPLAGALSLAHRLSGVFTTLTGIVLFMYLLKHLPKWKPVLVIALFAMVAQIILGLQMGRSSSRELIIFHFTFALLAFCSTLYILVRLRRFEFTHFGKAVATYTNDVMDLFKPKLTVLVVVSVMVGVFLAPLNLNIIFLIIGCLAIWLQAAGSLALNCYLEIDIDRQMERTKDRPLPAGRLAPQVAFNWGWGLIILGTIILFLVSNALTAILGLISALMYIYWYTPMKTKSPYALFVGAIPGALPTLMGWTLMTDSVAGMGAYLFGLLFLWQIPHFMAISYYRKHEYTAASVLTFAQTHTKQFIQVNILLYSLFIALYGLLPYIWGWRGEAYFYSSFMTGIILSASCFLAFQKSEEQMVKFSRFYFFMTIFYLPIQLGILLILR